MATTRRHVFVHEATLHKAHLDVVKISLKIEVFFRNLGLGAVYLRVLPSSFD